MTRYQFKNPELQNQLIKLMDILKIDYFMNGEAISCGEPDEDEALSTFNKDERLFIDLIHILLNKRFDSHRSYMVMKNDFKEYLVKKNLDYEEVLDGDYTNFLVEISTLNEADLKALSEAERTS